MISKRAFVIVSAVSLCSMGVLVPASARANVGGGAPIQSAAVERVQPLLLADVVVNGQQPAPAPVVVQPQQAPEPVVETPARHTTVIEHEPHNDMSTIALSALMGGVAGVLVGGAIYYLADNRQHSGRILYWGAGGVLVGTGVGVVQVASEESRLDRAAALHLPTDPAPTYRLALYNVSF
jgi:hypothetical protein